MLRVVRHGLTPFCVKTPESPAAGRTASVAGDAEDDGVDAGSAGVVDRSVHRGVLFDVAVVLRARIAHYYSFVGAP